MHAVAHRRVALLLRGQPPAMRPFERLAGRIEIVDLEAEMVDAAEIGAVCAHVRRPLVFVVQDGDMDVAVGQEHRAVRAAAQLLKPEGRFVELGYLRRLLRRQRDVLDPRHQSVPSQPVCEMSMTTPSGPDHFISKLAWPPAAIVASTWSFAVRRWPCAPSSFSQAWSRS